MSAHNDQVTAGRRRFLRGAIASLGLGAIGVASPGCALAQDRPRDIGSRFDPYKKEKSEFQLEQEKIGEGLFERFGGRILITKLETRLVLPRWLFLEIHTDEGIVGLGEPILEGRARTCAAAVEEIAP